MISSRYNYVLSDSPRALEIRADLPPESAALKFVRRGALNGYSVEFHARQERREGAIRVVERAELVGIGLVDQPAYPSSKAEVRARSGRRMRSEIPYDRDLACECIAAEGAGSGGTCIPIARFHKVAGEAMAEMLAGAFGEAERQRDILAVAGNFRRPLGSVSRATLRGRSTDTGLEVEIDLPVGTVADEIIAAHETAGVVIRPLIDPARSEFTDTDRGREYTRPHLRALLIGSTDTKSGWPDPTIDYGDPESRAAPAPQRRLRAWL